MPRYLHIDGKVYTEHSLNTDGVPFEAIQSGVKTFEFPAQRPRV